MSSPDVNTKETDLTFRIQSEKGNSGGFVGTFKWGVVEKRIFISNGEEQLVQTFHKPDDETAVSFLSAANFLLYVNALEVVRIAGVNAKNAVPDSELSSTTTVKNTDDYEQQSITFSVIGRYLGALANGLTIELVDSTGFVGWQYADKFQYTPSTNEYNMVIIDSIGAVSGTAGTILEKYELVSSVVGSKSFDGSTSYIKDVIKSQSNYVLIGDFTDFTFTSGVSTVTLDFGVDDNSPTSLDAGFALFSNVDEVDVRVLFTGDAIAADVQKVVDYSENRNDCYGVFSPTLADVYNNNTVLDDVISYRTTDTNKNTSFGVMDCNWKLVYDRYNDINRYIPCSSDTAGLIASVFTKQEPWFSPAGYNRGQLKNVIRLAWNPDKTQRNKLYKNGINPIVSFAGEGIFLFGDKTQLTRPSAFDRINVRSLFMVVEKAISKAAKYQLFELNDETTRSVFRNATTSYLRDVQGRRGIYDYYVKVDDENNTPQVIDSNQFIGDIFIKPARSINNIELNFVATSTGVDFSEIENSV